MSRIYAENISVAYQEKMIISNLSCELLDNKITTLIGPNGCGKSTLLKALTRILKVQKGIVYLDGESIAKMPTKTVAKKLALLPQVLESAEGILVHELIAYGRYPHQNSMGKLTIQDKEKISWAMKMTHVTEYAHMKVDDLSGGQRQRVWIAMALAQDTDIIFLDEPTTYLDMNHQLEVLQLLETLNKQNGKTIVMVLHDLNLAARFSDEMIAMKAGQIKYHDTVANIIQPKILKDIFNIEAHIVQSPINHKPVVLTYDLGRDK